MSYVSMSRLVLKVAALLSATTTLLASSVASATNYSLWIHGRNPSQSAQIGNYADFSYWGPSSTAGGINKKAVNWAGAAHIADSNGAVRNALDCYCTGTNFCYIAAHSAGNAQIGYALALYGSSTRTKKNATPNASGVCGNASTGGTQTGWNIKWVDVGGGAAGGSELANLGYWAVGDDITSDLRTSTMRALYNHNTTASKTFFMFAGSKGRPTRASSPGRMTRSCLITPRAACRRPAASATPVTGSVTISSTRGPRARRMRPSGPITPCRSATTARATITTRRGRGAGSWALFGPTW